MPQVELSEKDIQNIKEFHRRAMFRLNNALIENATLKEVLCNVRGAMFEQTSMMHQINLAEGTAK